MNPVKNRFLMAAALTLAVTLMHDSAYADECPSPDFKPFLSAFSANPQAQQGLSAVVLNSLVLKPAAGEQGFEPHTSKVERSGVAFPVIAPIPSDKTEGIEIEPVDDNHINVVDKRSGNSAIKIFNFARRACWELEGIEDWSIKDSDLPASIRLGMRQAQSNCYERADAYSGLAGAQLYSLTVELFEAALENYVCAAESGDPEASLNAASLSLSGMAPQLEDEKVEALFKTAATTLADGAASLSTFYCYGNTIAPEGFCLQPAKAEKELIRAATMGSVAATNYLGYVLEKGVMATLDVARAKACYQLAADKGDEAGAHNVKRLATEAPDIPAADQCFQ